MYIHERERERDKIQYKETKKLCLTSPSLYDIKNQNNILSL